MSGVNTPRRIGHVYESGSMRAPVHDQRILDVVASARIPDHEKHCGVRRVSRITRRLQPTEKGRVVPTGACRIPDAIGEPEEAIADATKNQRGTIFVATPSGVGRRLIAPVAPACKDPCPRIDLRLRLPDRVVDANAEDIHAAFDLGLPDDSTLKVRLIID